MPRSYNERQHYTERYQARQIKRKGPFKDYERRPHDTFVWELMGYEIYPRYSWNGPNDYPTPEQLGYYRNHSAYSCSCRFCRWDSDYWDARWMKKYRGTWKQDQDYHDGLAEYYSEDKYHYN